MGMDTVSHSLGVCGKLGVSLPGDEEGLIVSVRSYYAFGKVCLRNLARVGYMTHRLRHRIPGNIRR